MAAEKWPMRLFTKNTGPCEPATGSIWADTCPVLEGQGESLESNRSGELKPQ